VKGTPESGKIRLAESRKIAKEKRENSDAIRMLLRARVQPATNAVDSENSKANRIAAQ
jgi:hypothetical protein